VEFAAIPCWCRLRHRAGARCQDLGGGAGGIELHLRPLQRGLDRRPCRCAQLPGRGPEGARGRATAPTTESAPVLRPSRPPNARGAPYGDPHQRWTYGARLYMGTCSSPKSRSRPQPQSPLRGRDHFLCGSWHFLRRLRNGGELSANARVVSAMLQHRMGCLVAVGCRLFTP
jgi:hypothetical protein